LLEISRKSHMLRIKEIWFSECPFDVDDCDVVMFSDCRNKVDLSGFTCKPKTTSIINLTQPLEQIWKNMSKSSCRYAIRRAERDGVIVKVNQNYREFQEINTSFRLAKRLPEYVYSKNLIDIIKRYGVLFIAKYNWGILGGLAFLTDGDTFRWLVGASKRLQVDGERATLIGNANKLMIWEAIKYAKALGAKEFDMGGIYTGENKDDQRYTISKFKLGFGGEVKTHYDYQKVYFKLYSFALALYQLKQACVARARVRKVAAARYQL